MRILLVDDDAAVRRALARVLEHLGYEVRTFAEPAEAAEAVAADAHAFHGALLDVNIGAEDGVALAARLRSIAPALPIAFITGSDASAERASPHGTVLRKPCDVGLLDALIESWKA